MAKKHMQGRQGNDIIRRRPGIVRPNEVESGVSNPGFSVTGRAQIVFHFFMPTCKLWELEDLPVALEGEVRRILSVPQTRDFNMIPHAVVEMAATNPTNVRPSDIGQRQQLLLKEKHHSDPAPIQEVMADVLKVKPPTKEKAKKPNQKKRGV